MERKNNRDLEPRLAEIIIPFKGPGIYVDRVYSQGMRKDPRFGPNLLKLGVFQSLEVSASLIALCNIYSAL